MARNQLAHWYRSKALCEALAKSNSHATFTIIWRQHGKEIRQQLGGDWDREGRNYKNLQKFVNGAKNEQRKGNSVYIDNAKAVLKKKKSAVERIAPAPDAEDDDDDDEEEEEDSGEDSHPEDDKSDESVASTIESEDEEEQTEMEDEAFGGLLQEEEEEGQGLGPGPGQDNVDGGGGGLGQDNCPDSPNGGRVVNENIANLALLQPQPRAPSLTVSNDGTLGADSVSIAAIQAHTRISQDVISKNTAMCKMTQRMIHRTLRHSRGTSRSTLFPGIVPTIAFLCLVAAVFIHVGSQEGRFNVGTFGKAYFAGSAPNAQQLSSFDDIDLAVMEKIADAGTETMGLINSINIDVRKSLMEIYRTRGVRSRSSSFQKGDDISEYPHDSTEASDAYVGKASGASGDSTAENSPPSLPPSSTPSSDSKLASTSSGASGHTVLSSTSKKWFDDDQKGPSVIRSEMTAADEIPPTSTYRCLSGSDCTSIDGASIVTNDKKGGGKSNAEFLDNNKAAECETVSNVTKVSANATVSEDSPACISGGNATDARSQNISSGDSNSSAPIDKGEAPPSSGTAPEPNTPLKNPPPSAPKVVAPPPDGGVHDSTTTAADGGDDDVEGTRGSGRSSDYNSHKRMAIVGMAARALWQYPMVCVLQLLLSLFILPSGSMALILFPSSIRSEIRIKSV